MNMEEFPNKTVELCNKRFQDVFASYSAAPGRVVISHFGEFSQDLVNNISMEVEQFMFDEGDKKGVVKRMFSILVEGLQNIRIHGEQDTDGHQSGFVLVGQDDDHYRVTMANLIPSSRVENISGRIEEINEMDAAEIKTYYMEVLTNGVISSKGGAGLGFITMAMKSKNKLSYSMEQVDEGLHLFIVESKLERVSKKG